MKFRKVLYEAVERGEDHRRALEHFRPVLDLAARKERMSSGRPILFEEQDLLAAIFIERGALGAHVRRPEIAMASRVIATLDALPSAFDGL